MVGATQGLAGGDSLNGQMQARAAPQTCGRCPWGWGPSMTLVRLLGGLSHCLDPPTLPGAWQRRSPGSGYEQMRGLSEGWDAPRGGWVGMCVYPQMLRARTHLKPDR